MLSQTKIKEKLNTNIEIIENIFIFIIKCKSILDNNNITRIIKLFVM